jgi:hypothetical protein
MEICKQNREVMTLSRPKIAKKTKRIFRLIQGPERQARSFFGHGLSQELRKAASVILSQ